jgi:hypothetical protein
LIGVALDSFKRRINAMLKREVKPLIQCDREISLQEISEIQETVRLFPKLSRQELVATICEHLEWHTATGSYKLDACRKLLIKLEGKGLIRLPRKQEAYRREKYEREILVTRRTEAQPAIELPLRELGPVRIKAVTDKEGTHLWNEYVSRYHYLGYKKPFGYFLRYFVVSERGIVGCLLFAGAAKALTVRDRWIGWSERQRLRNLSWVVNNSRFLIFPWVQVRNLASHVLGRVSKRVREDWYERWGYRPVLLETFVDPRYYHGISYRASNWEYLGMTTGEGLIRKGKRYRTTPKMLLVKPLVKDFRSQLCSEHLHGRVVEA